MTLDQQTSSHEEQANKKEDGPHWPTHLPEEDSPMASITLIAKYLALFQELYPTRDITGLTAEAWEYALADVGDRAFEWSADKILREPGRTFFPSPNEIRSYMSSTRRTTTDGPSRISAGPDVAEPITQEQAAEWKRVKDSMRS